MSMVNVSLGSTRSPWKSNSIVVSHSFTAPNPAPDSRSNVDANAFPLENSIQLHFNDILTAFNSNRKERSFILE